MSQHEARQTLQHLADGWSLPRFHDFAAPNHWKRGNDLCSAPSTAGRIDHRRQKRPEHTQQGTLVTEAGALPPTDQPRPSSDHSRFPDRPTHATGEPLFSEVPASKSLKTQCGSSSRRFGSPWVVGSLDQPQLAAHSVTRALINMSGCVRTGGAPGELRGRV